jgi:Fur family peroxide stress response transcriptional regulator
MADGRGLGRFDGNLGDHQHVICSDCGRISDLDVPFDLSAPARAAARAGFEILSHRVELYGRCPDCVLKRRRARGRGKR